MLYLLNIYIYMRYNYTQLIIAKFIKKSEFFLSQREREIIRKSTVSFNKQAFFNFSSVHMPTKQLIDYIGMQLQYKLHQNQSNQYESFIAIQQSFEKLKKILIKQVKYIKFFKSADNYRI